MYEQAAENLVRHWDGTRIDKLVRTVNRATSQGPDGLSAPMLRVMVSEDPALKAVNPRLRDALATLMQRFALGHIPVSARPHLVRARLVPIPKPLGGTRPIAIGNLLRRQLGRLLAQDAAQTAQQHLAPFQFGVAVPGAAEQMCHSVRAAVEAGGDNVMVAQFDFANAFNDSSRATLLTALRAHFPGLVPYFELCYRSPADLLALLLDVVLESAWGVQQGDPLGTLFYAVLQQPLLVRLHAAGVAAASQAVAATAAAAGADTAAAIPVVAAPESAAAQGTVLAFADDSVVLGTPAFVLAVMREAAVQAPPAADTTPEQDAKLRADVTSPLVRLNPSKCWVWAPTNSALARFDALHSAAPLPDFMNVGGRGGVKVAGPREGITLMGVPIGAEKWEKEQLREYMAKEVAPALSRLAAVDHVQSELLILRQCITSKVGHVTRLVPPASTEEFTAAFDMALRGALERIMLQRLPPRAWEAAQDPLRHGGMGLRSASGTRSHAWLAAWSHTVAQSSQAAQSPYLRAALAPFFDGRMAAPDARLARPAWLCSLQDAWASWEVDTLETRERSGQPAGVPPTVWDLGSQGPLSQHQFSTPALQELFDRKVDAAAAAGDVAQLCRLRSTMHVPSLLMAYPSSPALSLTSEQMRTTLRYRLDLVDPDTVACIPPGEASVPCTLQSASAPGPCGLPIRAHAHHYHNCRQSTLYVNTHSSTQHIMGSMFRAAGLQAYVEVPVVGCNDRKKMDLLMPDARRGATRALAVEVKVGFTAGRQDEEISHGCARTGAVGSDGLQHFLEKERDAREQWKLLLEEDRMDLEVVAVNDHGRLSPNTHRLIREAARLANSRRGVRENDFVLMWTALITLAVLRTVADEVALAKRLQHKPGRRSRGVYDSGAGQAFAGFLRDGGAGPLNRSADRGGGRGA